MATRKVKANLPFRRVYMDLPAEVYEAMTAKARIRGMTNKDYMASLVQADAKRK